MTYEFKGYDWSELAECWGITVTAEPFTAKVVNEDGSDTNEVVDMGTTPEMINKVIVIEGQRITFELSDEEEVLAEKVKQHLWNSLDRSQSDFKDPQLRTDIVTFLKKLAEEEEGEFGGYNAPMYRGMAEIENDFTLVRWLTHNLESLWT